MGDEVITEIMTKGVQYSAELIMLASGAESHIYVDAKAALCRGEDLRDVAEAVIAHAPEPFDVVGGMTMGADPIACAVAMQTDCAWFSMRKAPKGRGLNRYIEGASIGKGTRVLLVEDVVTTGVTLLRVYTHMRELGAEVVGIIVLVDRSNLAQRLFAAHRVPYHALVTYHDLGIAPV